MKNKIILFFSLGLLSLVCTIYVFAFPDKGHNFCVLFYGQPIFIHDGIDLSGKNIPYSRINFELGELRDVNFSNSYLCWSDLDETRFINCSFRRANLAYVTAPFSSFENCDFTDAIVGGSNITISNEQLFSTESFKHKRLPGYRFCGDLSGVDFSGFDLKGASFLAATLTDCKFFNADIAGCSFRESATKEQLFSTRDFRSGNVIGVYLWAIDFSDSDLSKMNFTNSKLYTNLLNVNLSDSVITGCYFDKSENLTLAQIKSTWNYKVGRMEGIKLPKEIQDALDAEKEVSDE